MDQKTEAKAKKGSMIPLRDFIYLCVILAVILISIISFYHGDSSRAGEMLNFGATLVSIVLAVIAIVMTIMDSSGQKQNTLQLKEAVESIQENIADLNEVTNNSRAQFESIVHLREDLIKQLADTTLLQKSISEKLDKVIDSKDENEKVSVSELRDIKSELKEMQIAKNILDARFKESINRQKRFTIGDKVYHDTLGHGVVMSINVSIASGKKYVDVEFESGKKIGFDYNDNKLILKED